MKYYIIAGEASGDTHAANLIRAVRQRDPQAEFRGWGGDKMAEQGAELVKHYRDLAFMGLYEVIKNLPEILGNLSFCKKDILSFNPDVVILVDYPGFNLRIADFTHKKKIKTVYYISPQIWAWHRSRVHKIKKIVDLMMVILPFEKDFYRQYGVPVTYVGHPLLDELNRKKYKEREVFLKENKLDNRPVIALLPGSRAQEIESMLGVMLQMVPLFPDYQFVIAGSGTADRRLYQKTGEVPVVYGSMHDLLAHSEAALVTSGTASLEAALIGTPEVVCYRTSRLTYEVAKRVIRVKYISLVNLILDKPVVAELIQDDLNVQNLKKELDALLFDEQRRKMLLNDYRLLREKLGNTGASGRAAEAVHAFLTGKK